MKLIYTIMLLTFVQGQELTVPGYECSDCHGTGGWEEIELSNFSHANTNFQLEGAHGIANCVDCHTGSTIGEKHDFSQVTSDCNSCHLDIHQNTLGNECSRCHTSLTWIVQQQLFNHEETQFPLVGGHRNVNCNECHDDLTNIDVTPTDCFSCHHVQYKTAQNPSHFLSGMSTDCSECHGIEQSAWVPSSFDHNVQTSWELTGAHFGAECSGCHVGEFLGTPNDCWSCHEQEFIETGSGQFPDAPNHIENFYSQSCEVCHTTIEWKGGEINHDLTEFPLTGNHQTTDCAQCHINGNYDVPLDCAGCHAPSGLAETDYTTAEYDHLPHNIAGFCESCHETVSWDQLIFSHSTFTGETCIQCHSPEYDGTDDPPHANGNISNDCQLCHSTNDWEDDGSFTHSDQQTEFVLHGLHIPVACESCHVNNVYNGLSVNCESSGCHLSTFESTTDPNHTDYGYPAEYCEECHNANGWEPIIFSHQLSLACMTCHMTEYNEADDPVHDEASGFTTTCEDCHTATDTWEGASFSHTGVTDGCADCHMDDFYQDHNDGDPTNCEACHTTEDWEDVSFDHEGVTDGCVDCHMDDYNDTDDPDHESWGYPTNCEECHFSTTDWSDASFSHSFPISPNEHQDETTETCASCHPDGNADSFTCFSAGCHTESDMQNEHCEDGPNDCESCNGFTYPSSGVTSEDCVACHPNGNEDDCDGGDRILREKNKLYWRNQFLPN